MALSHSLEPTFLETPVVEFEEIATGLQAGVWTSP